MAEFTYEVKEKYGVLSESAKGWTREVRLVSWNGGKDKIDIRDWAPNDEKMGKGISLTEEEASILRDILGEINS